MIPNERTRILLVDDHEATRREIARLIDRQPDMVIVGDASTGEEGVSLSAELSPSLVVMDIFMPGINGFEATEKIVEGNRDVLVIALSNCNGSELEYQVRQSGAMGYVHKSNAYEELVAAIRAVVTGKEYFHSND